MVWNKRFNAIAPKIDGANLQDLDLIKKLHTRDIVCLVAVLMNVKPIASIVVPLEIAEWLQRFCEKNHLAFHEDGPRDAYQTRMTVSYRREKVKLKRALDDIRSFLNQTSQLSSKRDLARGLTWVEGAMYDYPECCVELHAEEGPSSRSKAYEEFLDSGMDQSVPGEFWAVAHAPCSSICERTLELGRKYLDAVAEYSESLGEYLESKLLLPRFYQTGGGRFIELQPLDYNKLQDELAVSNEEFADGAMLCLPEPVETVLCKIPRPYVIVDKEETLPCKTAFPNPDMIGTMWLGFSPGFGAYMVNAKTGQLALHLTNDKWIPRVGEEWRSGSNFRIYSPRRNLR